MNKQTSNDTQGWDEYWLNSQEKSRLYELVAEFYRKFILKWNLNYFIRISFKKNSNLLHAGYGSGRVDEGVLSTMSVTALDTSTKALEIYKKIHKNDARTLMGSILKIPSSDNKFDGIYNLGVMEHFTLAEINTILAEFKRVLKPSGKLLIFWPPRYGLTVRVLHVARIFLNSVLRMNVRFHPDEPSLIKSKRQVISNFKEAGFEVKRYYFGIRDLFTQVVILAENKE